MGQRFDGPNGRRAIIEVLLEHRLVQHDEVLANRIAEVSALTIFSDGQSIIEQGETSADVYFILSGEAAVFVNKRKVATRGPSDAVGEMAAIDPTTPRSATVRSSGSVTILDEFPRLWKPIAKTAARRLRERQHFHRPPNATPVLFVGSSVEGLVVAREVQSQLKHDNVEVRVWTTGVFGSGGVSIDSLLEQTAMADFAVFVFGPDDRVSSRDAVHSAPRDNVIFEMGLFMGRIGRERVFMLMEHGRDLKIPSDLLGVIPLTFVQRASVDLKAVLGPTCHELRTRIETLGVL
jgi:CRP/FNR family cyclic AMP-dependent transcriptional regulator